MGVTENTQRQELSAKKLGKLPRKGSIGGRVVILKTAARNRA